METIEDYKKAILDYIIKQGNNTELGIALNQARRSELRRILQQKATHSLTPSDRHFISLELKINSDTLTKELQTVSAEAFRNVENFIKEETRVPSSINVIELAAILIDFPNRPFASFRTRDTHYSIEEQLLQTEKPIRPQEVKDSIANPKPEPLPPLPKTKWSKKITFTLAGMLVLALTFWGINALKSPDYMQWQNDHYEVVENAAVTPAGAAPILAYDAEEFLQKKVNLKDSTVFFKDGKPLYFYAKVNGQPEFFTQDGNHPAYPEKELHKITHYMVEKYLSK